ncbi:MAG TPA: 3-hydroxyacyl-CoA dehydrogenase family protein [Candidatus Angelobacter sp.]|nr:3-hydroxyacyl-CoA dehydrogenase family protein [Candidatus Angelobacter sp.]
MAEVRTIAVIGAGTMGRGIARLCAAGGYRTILEDILPSSLRSAENEIRAALDLAIKNATLTSAAAQAALARTEYASSVEQAARDADLVIEAVPDEMESKLEMFTLLDKLSKPATMLVATTTTLNVAELASVTYRGGKILGMRFSADQDGLKLREIVRTQQTDKATVAACVEIARRMGQEASVIVEKDRTSALP